LHHSLPFVQSFRDLTKNLLSIDSKRASSKKQTLMKKLTNTPLFFLMATTSTFAQIGGIEDSVNDISDTIRTIFPIILGVIFLIGFLFNAGHFFGENADLKKGITRVLVFVLIAGAVVGIFTYLITLVV
jgi:hypothetical protein